MQVYFKNVITKRLVFINLILVSYYPHQSTLALNTGNSDSQFYNTANGGVGTGYKSNSLTSPTSSSTETYL